MQPTDPAPYGGDPPAEAVTDCHEVANQVDLHTESSQAAYDLPFAVERPAGFYYLQVRAILFRTQAGKVFAQAEQFFFARRPLPLTEEPLGSHAARGVAADPAGGTGHLRRRGTSKSKDGRTIRCNGPGQRHRFWGFVAPSCGPGR